MVVTSLPLVRTLCVVVTLKGGKAVERLGKGVGSEAGQSLMFQNAYTTLHKGLFIGSMRGTDDGFYP